MKSGWILSLLLLFVLTSSACQIGGFLSSPEATEEPQPPNQGYPAPPQGYPAPGQPYPYPYPGPYSAPPLLPNPEILYPDMDDGAEVIWFHAIAMLNNGEVTEVLQTHDLKVFITLKDGRTLVTVEPEIDTIFKEIENCGEKCKDIVVATE